MAKTKKQKASQEESQEASSTQTKKSAAEEEKKEASADASEAEGGSEERMEEDDEPSKEAEDALEALQAEIAQVKAEEIEKVRMSGARVSAYAQRVDLLYQTVLKDLREHFKILPEKKLGLLCAAALAFWRARRDVELIDPTSYLLRKHYEEAGELKEVVSDVLKVVGRGDADVQRVLVKIRPGTGFEDRANDLQDLYPTVKQYREILLKKELLTKAQIDSMPKLAASLLAPSKEKAALKDARLLRDRAWTYFLGIQKEMARYLRFIYHDQPATLAQLELYATAPNTTSTASSKSASGKKASSKSNAAKPTTPTPPEPPSDPTPDNP